MKLYNPFKRIKQLETHIDVLEGILEEKYELIERNINLIEKLEKSLNEHGIKTAVEPEYKPIFTGRGDYIKSLRIGDIAIAIDTTEHDRKVLGGSKHE